ncbi:MAG: sel1 repeat family protein [Deltaproteobacteria bacterium]|jgi:hypothetical protein|nr:sel1 repeat family protein [Deltaproteobacteria bacterium]
MPAVNPEESAESLFEKGKRFYLNTSERQQDPDMAVACFERSAALGYPPAQRLIGVLNLSGDIIAQNYAEAFKWLTLAAEKGDQLACFYLAQMYALGQGIAKDWAKAHFLLNRPGVSSIPEALELKRRLKEEIVRLYPNLAAALREDDKIWRLRLTRRQQRFIPAFLDCGRSQEGGSEFDTWLALNMGRIGAEEAYKTLKQLMDQYYADMIRRSPAEAAAT